MDSFFSFFWLDKLTQKCLNEIGQIESKCPPLETGKIYAQTARQ